MRKVLLYLAGLAVASAAVFSAIYLLGRNSTLEDELERLTAPRPAAEQAKSRGIPSLQPREAPSEESPAGEVALGEPLGEGIAVTRSPLEPPGLVIVADLPALASQYDGPAITDGLNAFLSRPPDGLEIGVRALAGATGYCGSTDEVQPLGPATGSGAMVLGAAMGLGLGPRNPAGAVRDAADQLERVSGERAIVVLAGGEEECWADLCGSAPVPGGPAHRVHVVLFAAPPRPGSAPGMPEAATDLAPRPVFEPAWASPYRCLAGRSGGTIATATSPAELEAALRGIAADLESAVVVRAFHYMGQEVKGITAEGASAWGALVRPARDELARGGRLRESEVFPAAFAVPTGVYVVKARFGGQERTAAVAVAPAERAEVSVTFATGELFVQALDAAGREIVGDSAGFGCAWGVEALAGEGEDMTAAAGSCSFPARLELTPGPYRIRARWKGIERIVDEVAVESGASLVHTVSFGSEEPEGAD